MNLFDRIFKVCYNKAMKIKYYKHKLEKLIVVENIVTIHYLELKKDFVYPKESHDFWELTYVDKESVTVWTEEGEIEVQEGEMLFLKPNETHSHSANGRTTNVFILSFGCKSRAMNFFEGRKLHLPKSFAQFVYKIVEEGKKTFNLPRYNPNLTKMELLENPTLGGEQLIKNYLEILLISMMRAETEKEGVGVYFLRDKEESESITARAISFMKENVHAKLTVAEICEELHYNKSYLFRTFKRDTGSTVIAYFTRLKIEQAKRYLREGKLNVAQIAELLAFDTPNYFTKTFRKITGYSPLQYKKFYLSNV